MTTTAVVDLVDAVEHEEKARPAAPVRVHATRAERPRLSIGLFVLVIAAVQVVWVAALAYGAALLVF